MRYRLNLNDNEIRKTAYKKLKSLNYTFHKQYIEKAPFIFISPEKGTIGWGYPEENDITIELEDLNNEKKFKAKKKANIKARAFHNSK